MSDETISLGGTFDATFLTHLRALKAALQNGTLASATIKIGPAGNGAGKPWSQREALLTSLSVSSSTSDVVTLSCEFQRTGDTTDGVYP